MPSAVALVSPLAAFLFAGPLASTVSAQDATAMDTSSSLSAPTASPPNGAQAPANMQGSAASDTDLPDRERVRLVLSELDTQIAEVERKRSQINWARPSVVMGLGVGLTVAGIFLARFNSELSDSLGPEGEEPSSPSAGAYLICVSPGVFVILVGATQFVLRARKHEALTAERDQLLNQKRILTSALVPSVSRSHLGLELRLRF